MARELRHRWEAFARLTILSLRRVGGRSFWALVFLPSVWLAVLAAALASGWRETAFTPRDATFTLIGLPLAVLAIGLGVRIIAREIAQRTLEVVYTVPGGARRVWLPKVLGAVLLLAGAEALLGLATWWLFTDYPAAALYGAFQGAVFYLALAAALAVT